MEESIPRLKLAQWVSPNNLSIRGNAKHEENNGTLAPRINPGFQELPTKTLPGANKRGQSGLVNIFNNSGKRQVATLRRVVSGKNANAARNLSSGAKSYVDQGSLNDIFNSMGIFKKRSGDSADPAVKKDESIKIVNPLWSGAKARRELAQGMVMGRTRSLRTSTGASGEFLNDSQEERYKHDLEKTFTSPAFQEGAIKLALIRLIISGRIQYRENKFGILDMIIGENYKFSNSDLLKGQEKEDFDKVIKLIAEDDIDSFDFHYRGGIRKLVLDIFLFLFFSHVFTGVVISVIFALGYRSKTINADKALYKFKTSRRPENMNEETFSALEAEHEAALEAMHLAEASFIITAIPMGLIIALLIKLIMLYSNISRDKQLIIDVLIKLLDTFLRSNELIFRALGSESISNVPLLYKDAESLAIYYKYVNELKRLGVKQAEDTKERHIQLSNFISGENCPICQTMLASPLMDSFELCKNHHKFHKVCSKAYYNKNNNFKCPVCRESPLPEVLEELKNYTPFDFTKAGGSRKKQKTRKNKKETSRHRRKLD
jgi:hypothetical protein